MPGEFAAHRAHSATANHAVAVAPASTAPPAQPAPALTGPRGPIGQPDRNRRDREQHAEQRSQQHPAVNEVAALADPVGGLQKPAGDEERDEDRGALHPPAPAPLIPSPKRRAVTPAWVG